MSLVPQSVRGNNSEGEYRQQHASNIRPTVRKFSDNRTVRRRQTFSVDRHQYRKLSRQQRPEDSTSESLTSRMTYLLTTFSISPFVRWSISYFPLTSGSESSFIQLLQRLLDLETARSTSKTWSTPRSPASSRTTSSPRPRTPSASSL
jgi:hypothetical protein